MLFYAQNLVILALGYQSALANCLYNNSVSDSSVYLQLVYTTTLWLTYVEQSKEVIHAERQIGAASVVAVLLL